MSDNHIKTFEKLATIQYIYPTTRAKLQTAVSYGSTINHHRLIDLGNYYAFDITTEPINMQNGVTADFILHRRVLELSADELSFRAGNE